MADTVINSDGLGGTTATGASSMVDKPLWLQPTSGTLNYTGPEMRMLIDAIWQTEGPVTVDALKVIQNSPLGYSVIVKAGMAIVTGDTADAVTGRGKYLIKTVGDVVLTSPTTTAGHVHRVVARIQDAQASGSTTRWSLEFLQGTAGTPPALPDNCLDLALVTVGASNIQTTNIVDQRSVAGWSNPAVLFARKTSDEGRTSTTVKSAATGMSVTLEPNAVYKVDIVLNYTALPAADFSWDLAGPTGLTGTLTSLHSTPLTASVTQEFDEVSLDARTVTATTDMGGSGGTGTANLLYIRTTGVIVTTTGGACTVNFGQRTANATASTMKTNSYMLFTRVA